MDDAPAFAQTDPDQSRTLARAPDDHFVAVLEERPDFPVVEGNRRAAPDVSSSRQPRSRSEGPDTVPLAIRSPGRRLQPLLAWCATICSNVQYIRANSDSLTQDTGWPNSRILPVRMPTASFTSIPPRFRLPAPSR